MQAILDIVDSLGRRLGDLTNSDLVVGQPIVLGKTTVVPLSRASFGLGGGSGEGEGMHHAHHGKSGAQPSPGKGSSMGGGMGAQLRPVAVVLFSDKGVEVVPLPAAKHPLEKLLDRLPALAEKIHGAGKCCH